MLELAVMDYLILEEVGRMDMKDKKATANHRLKFSSEFQRRTEEVECNTQYDYLELP